jgi:hypothetical protein
MTEAAITQVFNAITVITNKGQAFLVVLLTPRSSEKSDAKAQREERT